MVSDLRTHDVRIAGHAQLIALRSYRPALNVGVLPIVIYLHGGGFVRGKLNDASIPAAAIARDTPAWVISVDYSLAPAFPFPTALEDAYCALNWATTNARAYGADDTRIGVAGDDSGGNLAAGLAALARDRGDVGISAQAMLAPMLDPALALRAGRSEIHSDEMSIGNLAVCYQAYLPKASQRLNPYAAPLTARRLAGLPPALIASAEHDPLHLEAEQYARQLIAAGVPTQTTRYIGASHHSLASDPGVLLDVAAFFRKRLRAVDATNLLSPMVSPLTSSEIASTLTE